MKTCKRDYANPRENINITEGEATWPFPTGRNRGDRVEV